MLCPEEELLSLPPASYLIFAMWFISLYLELMLRSHDKVFNRRKQWSHLLKKYSLCPEEELDLHKPVIKFQRNSHLSLAEEVDYEDYNVDYNVITFKKSMSKLLVHYVNQKVLTVDEINSRINHTVHLASATNLNP